MADRSKIRRTRRPVTRVPEQPPAGAGGISWPDKGLVGLGIGLAATGVGTLLGLAAERAAVARRIRPRPEVADDGRGGPPLGSLRGEPRVVISGEVPLHVEVDELPGGIDDPSPLTVVLSHGYALTLDSWHYQRLALRGRYRLVFWDQRGHGRSGTGPEGSSTIDQVGEDLAAVIDEVAPTGPLVLLVSPPTIATSKARAAFSNPR